MILAKRLLWAVCFVFALACAARLIVRPDAGVLLALALNAAYCWLLRADVLPEPRWARTWMAPAPRKG